MLEKLFILHLIRGGIDAGIEFDTEENAEEALEMLKPFLADNVEAYVCQEEEGEGGAPN